MKNNTPPFVITLFALILVFVITTSNIVLISKISQLQQQKQLYKEMYQYEKAQHLKADQWINFLETNDNHLNL